MIWALSARHMWHWLHLFQEIHPSHFPASGRRAQNLSSSEKIRNKFKKIKVIFISAHSSPPKKEKNIIRSHQQWDKGSDIVKKFLSHYCYVFSHKTLTHPFFPIPLHWHKSCDYDHLPPHLAGRVEEKESEKAWLQHIYRATELVLEVRFCMWNWGAEA